MTVFPFMTFQIRLTNDVVVILVFLQINLRDGNYAGSDGLDPTISWEGMAKSGDIDIEYGIRASVRPTTDLSSFPRNIWGKASTYVNGWDLSFRTEFGGQDNEYGYGTGFGYGSYGYGGSYYNRRNTYYAGAWTGRSSFVGDYPRIFGTTLEFDADNDQADVNIHIEASASDGRFLVRSIEATKGFDFNEARMSVSPRFNFDRDDGDIEINFQGGQTDVLISATPYNQEIKFSQQVNEENRIAPSINSLGDFAFEWERRLRGDNTFKVSVSSLRYLGFQWRDSIWTANVNIPVDGSSMRGASVNIKRDLLTTRKRGGYWFGRRPKTIRRLRGREWERKWDY